MSAPNRPVVAVPAMPIAIVLVAVLVAVGLVLPGCADGKDRLGRGDAPVEGGRGDDSPANVINMPDRFSNVAFKCWGPNGIYVTTAEVSPVVVPDDAQCERSDGPR